MNISQSKLQEIIESHGKWLRGEEGGNRANLGGANLGGANLGGANLRGANLRGANLGDANLGGAETDKKYLQISCIGSRRGTTTYCVDDDLLLCGCWNNYKGGTLKEFVERVESVYGGGKNEKYYAEYMAAVDFFKAVGVAQGEK